MTIRATRTTAVVAGAGTALGLTLFDIWERNHGIRPMVQLAAAFILWVAPVTLFAVGFDLKRWDPNYVYEPAAQADYREIGMRTVFWLIGNVVCNLALRIVI
jgi:hypothetical protein